MLLCLWVIVMLFSSFGSMAEAIGPQYRESLKRNYRWMIIKNPRYISDCRIPHLAPVSRGVDCFRYMYLVYRWSGVPGVGFTTAGRAANGEAGWTGKTITLKKAGELDLVWWTFKQNRPNGHIGALLKDDHGMPGVTHASSSRGVVLDQMKGWAIKKLTKVRRITIGE